ncbi:uncharacterized protein LOC127751315 [Frankliniella occidentalis]|uniref:Uncharacterized protein LOC127751315 n=1 Tax=Frankliniella occidentalis TaxID=133901 RepID=A0A9C6X7L1_FRAOC|nr:uncharacterized protein LOC127751315 [Frankliniella occidentalis]
MQRKYDDLKETQIEDIVKNLPPRQKEAVLACIYAAKAKSSNGVRYTQQWVYECTLLRIKPPALYRKMRRDQTLVFPSPRTLQRYMKRLKPAYGFLPATFELLGKKSQEMELDERHGKLIQHTSNIKNNYLLLLILILFSTPSQAVYYKMKYV